MPLTPCTPPSSLQRHSLDEVPSEILPELERPSSLSRLSCLFGQESVETPWILCSESAVEKAVWISVIENTPSLQQERSRSIKGLGLTGTAVPLNRTSDEEPAGVKGARHRLLVELVQSEKRFVDCISNCLQTFTRPLVHKNTAHQARTINTRRQTSFSSQKRHSAHTKRLQSYDETGMRSFHSKNSRSTLTPEPWFVPSTPGSMASSYVLDPDMAVFFSSLEQIFTLNNRFLATLQGHLEETSYRTTTPLPNRIGALLDVHMPLFTLYASYATHHECALAVIQTNAFAVHSSYSMEDMSTFRAYLNMPLDRIATYTMVISELLENTPVDHGDYIALQMAQAKLRDVVNEVEDIMIRKKNSDKLRQMELLYNISLQGSRVVKDGMLQKVCRKSIKMYHVVLLNNTLFYGHTGMNNRNKCHRRIPLWDAQTNIITSPSQTTHANAFYFLSRSKSFILIAPSKSARTEWVSTIQVRFEIVCGFFFFIIS